MLVPAVRQSDVPSLSPQREAIMKEKASALEAVFLAEMLSFSGLGEVSDGFGGGAGEEQFASFLRQEQAKLMVGKGGIGLAELIFESLKTREEGGNVSK
jgi:peptidoglycan hydrolase FlgJ